MLARIRQSKWTRGLFKLLAWTALFLVLGYAALNVGARFAIKTVAAKLGFPDLKFEVRTVSLHQIVVGNIQLPGENAPRVASVEADYSVSELFSGKVRAVRIAGVEVEVDSGGHLTGVTLPSPSPAATKPAKPFSLLPGALPTTIDVASSVIRVRLPNGVVQFPLAAHYKLGPTGGKGEATISFGADELTVAVAGSTDGNWTATGRGAIGTGGILPLLPAGLLPPDSNIDARVSLDGNFDVGTDSGKLSATITGGKMRGRLGGEYVIVSQLNVDAQVDIVSGQVKSAASVSGTIRTGWLAGETKLLAQAAGAGDTWTGSVTAVGPSITLSVPNVQAGPNLSSADLSLVAVPPPWLLQQASAAGIILDSAASMSLKGHVQRLGDGSIIGSLTDILGSAKSIRPAAANVELSSAAISAARVDFTGRPSDSWTFAINDAVASVAAVRVSGTESPAKVTGEAISGTVNPDGTYSLSAPDVVVAGGPVDLSEAGAQVKGLAAQLHVSVAGSAEQVTATLKEASQISIAGATVAGGQYSLGPATMTLSPRVRPTTGPGAATGPATQPAPPLLLFRKGSPLQVAFNSQTSAPINLASETTKADVSRVVGNLQLTFGQQVGVDGYVRLEKADFDLPQLDAKVHGVTLSLPLNLDATTPREGQITMESFERDGRILPPMTGHLWVTRRGAYAGFEWPLISEGIVKGEVRSDFLPTGGANVDAHMWIPEFSFSKSEDVRKLLPPGLADLDITGRFAADLRYSISNGRVTRWGEIDVKDASMKSKKLGDTNLTGVNGKVWTRNFSPLETAPNQTLSVKSARLGDLVVSDGNVRFRIDPGDIIFIEDASFDFAGGTLSGRGFRLAPLQSATDLVLYADHLDLNQFAKIASSGRVSANGSLFARLPVSLNWDKRTLAIGTGYLYADARPGELSLGTSEPDVAKLLGIQPASDNVVTKRLTSSLTDFKYSALSLDLRRDGDNHLDGVARLAGKGADGTAKQALDLTLNLHGLDNGFEELLQLFLFK